MNSVRFVICLFFLLSTLISIGQGETTSLEIGDKAPSLSIIKWLKGESIIEFEKGKVYVVEFSGTWCGPCRKAIPHLTELSKKYKEKIPFISVYCEGNNKEDTTDLRYIKRVSNLVEALGDKMDFTVAVDEPQQSTLDAWKVKAFPTMFIIDGSGTISWIGTLPAQLDAVLADITQGKFDKDVTLLNQKRYKEIVENVYNLRDKGDGEAALLDINNLINLYPKDNWLLIHKFYVLAGFDDNEAYQWVQSLLNRKIEGLSWAYFVSYFNRINNGNRNYEFELKVIDRAIFETESEYYSAIMYKSKAETYAAMNNLPKAIEMSKKSVEICKRSVECGGEELDSYILSLCKYEYKLRTATNKKQAKTWLLNEVRQKRVKVSKELAKIAIEDGQDYDLALELNKQAFFESKKDKMQSRALLLQQSDIYALQGKYEKAGQACQQALRISEEEKIENYIQKDKKKLLELTGKETNKN